MIRKNGRVKVDEQRMRMMQVQLSAECAAHLDACQGLLNATNPEGGALNKPQVVCLAIDLLYRRLRPHQTNIKRVVKDLDAKAGRAGGKPVEEDQAVAGDQAEGEPVIDLNDLGRAHEEAVKALKAPSN